MRPSVALDRHRQAVRAATSRYPLRGARVFGSVLHGTDTDASDLDLLVEDMPGATLFQLGALRHDLETLLGVPVQLLSAGDLPPSFRDRVLAEAQPV